MNWIESAYFDYGLTSAPYVLRLGLLLADEESLRLASLGVELLIPGAYVVADHTTGGLLVTHDDSRMLESITAAWLNGELCGARHLRSLGGADCGMMMLELSTDITSDYFERFRAYVLELPGVVDVRPGPGGPRVVILDATISDFQEFGARLWAHLAFGFAGDFYY